MTNNKIKDFIDWETIIHELKELETLFKKVSSNPVEELRMSLPDGGGVLPGSKKTAGVVYAKETLLPKLTNTLLVLALSASTLMLVIGGLMYVMSFGEDDKKTKAKNMILYSIVGVVISILSYGIVKFVIGVNFNIL